MGGSGPVRISAELAANMPFLMDYYRVTVCPSMVLIDGPTNPFREHILQLAANSQSLQHAICALSACNLRIKRMLSLYQDTRKLLQKLMAEKQAAEAVPCTQLEDPSLSEEHQHRNLAISLLNQQLNNPINSDHDSSLATILLLCHYRMAKCGIAEIHTQFAGIKKFLSMRNQHFGQSSNSTWMQGLFTCYGTISASIDGRETRLASQFPVVQVVPRGIENFVGCDRELFKIISKLGRLSLLAQHRTTQSKLASNDARCSLCPLRSPLAYAYKDSMSGQGQPGDTHHPHPHHFDATSFCTALDNDEMLAPAIASSGAYDDYHSMFGYEWKESYLALQKWQFDSSTVAAWLPESPSSPQARDIGNLSETFRYAALLYMERLASPDLPSGHDSFQNLVSQIVYYAMSLESPGTAENFLLWPMFVAGSECIIELQQNIVRSKCRGIVFRSGYMNSMKAFDELERLWAGEYKDAESHSPRSNIPNRRGLLNWAKCMCGPGVDVQWIMF